MDTQYYKVPRIIFQQVLRYLRKQPFEEVHDFLITIKSESLGPFEHNEEEVNKKTNLEQKEEQ